MNPTKPTAKPKMVKVAGPCLLLYCRCGFEADLAEEITLAAEAQGVAGKAQFSADSAYVVFIPGSERDLERLRSTLRLADLIFARQLIWSFGIVGPLPADDRVTPMIDAIRENLIPWTENGVFAKCFVEPPETDEGKELSKFCTSLSRPIENALRRLKIIPKSEPKKPYDPSLHIFMLNASYVYIGLSDVGNESIWPMGIPRLKFPAGAPSRSALKLEEAFKTFFTPEEEAEVLQSGMTAIDLGAAPGGWTYVLTKHEIYVTAVDNANLDPKLSKSDYVDHIKGDALKYRPEGAVDWLVCDVIEQPSRIAALMGDWLERRLAKYAIFNLKLPMKKRLSEIRSCLEPLSEINLGKGRRLKIQVKQLYHDRQEVTVCAVPGPDPEGPRRRRR